MDIILLEKELKKRLKFPYHWGRKQNNEWDNQTNFIYKISSFDELQTITNLMSQELKDYAMNRWFNYWSAMGVEYIFAQNHQVVANKDKYDKLVDFKILNIPFDHKTSVFPQQYTQSLEFAQQNKKDLIIWLYINQSQQGRKHYANRLFVVLYSQNGEHWKMKANLSFLKQNIENYLNNFNHENLIILKQGENRIYSDIIFNIL